MSILCKLGLHDKTTATKFYPAAAAPIVTSFKWTTYCRRCQRVFSSETHVWDGKEFQPQGEQPCVNPASTPT